MTTIVVAPTYRRAQASAVHMGFINWVYASSKMNIDINPGKEFTLVLCGAELQELPNWHHLVLNTRAIGGKVIVLHD